MKLATIVLLGILLLGSFASMQAADPAGAGQVALAYTNGGSSTNGICIWYPLLVGDLNPNSLFAAGATAVDKEHAYLIWVSDYSGVELPSTVDFTLFLIPTGTATIYFSNTPQNRNWTTWSEYRSTWGEPVATFVRKAGIFPSPDGGNSGTLISTAELVSSKPFTLNGKTFNFKDLIPHGMTCFETGMGLRMVGPRRPAPASRSAAGSRRRVTIVSPATGGGARAGPQPSKRPWHILRPSPVKLRPGGILRRAPRRPRHEGMTAGVSQVN